MKTGFWQRGGLWVIAQSLIMLAALAAAPLWADGWHGWWSRAAAVCLLVSGAVFGIAGAAVLGHSRTIFPEPPPQAKLVRGGIYGIVRHPLYTSVILISLAWALWWRSIPGLGLAVAMLVFLDAKSRHEERRLRSRFPDYDDYARGVRRLLPWIY